MQSSPRIWGLEWQRVGESAGNREASGSVTHLLGHPEEEVAVSALLLPCPHEARLHTCRSGAELHGALACAAAAAAAAGSGRGLTCPLWLFLLLLAVFLCMLVFLGAIWINFFALQVNQHIDPMYSMFSMLGCALSNYVFKWSQELTEHVIFDILYSCVCIWIVFRLVVWCAVMYYTGHFKPFKPVKQNLSFY